MFRATVRMRKPWTDYFIRKPSKDDVLEAFADAVLRGDVDELFEITVEESA